MTPVRPEHGGAHEYRGDAASPRGRAAELRDAVEAMGDPLSDPLPGAPYTPQQNPHPTPPQAGAYVHGEGSPWFRRPAGPGAAPHVPGGAPGHAAGPYGAPATHGTGSARPAGNGPEVRDPYGPTGAEQYGYEPYDAAPHAAGLRQPYAAEPAAPAPELYGFGPAGPDPYAPRPYAPGPPAPDPYAPGQADPYAAGQADPYAPPRQRRAAPAPRETPADPDTATLRPLTASGTLAVDGDAPFADDDRSTVGLRRPEPAEQEAPAGGRAERRRASGKKGRSGSAEPRAAMSRVEARKAAKAAQREGVAVFLSRMTGEVFITVGVLMMLFVAYQLWWTNVLAGQEAGGAADSLQEQWDGGKKEKVAPERRAGSFAPGEGFALIHIPKLDVSTPIAQGIDKQKVLDKGLVGHYDEAPLKTAMPWDKKGNFALAGHRNTHGEPFRYVNRLVAGDEMVVETASKYYTYRMTNRLAATSPSNTSVIRPVPPQSGFTGSGRYITLTTCTPEFTSKYRLIVWGRMVDERPRSEGKPDALVE